MHAQGREMGERWGRDQYVEMGFVLDLSAILTQKWALFLILPTATPCKAGADTHIPKL